MYLSLIKSQIAVSQIYRLHLFLLENIVTTPIARQRVGKHVPAEANARKNRTSIARQRSSKHASLTIQDGVFRGVRAEELS
jgi:hypothetical protein